LGRTGVAEAGDGVFTVTKVGDTADGTCNSDCSLREAIIAANASPDASTIDVPAGVYKITLGALDNLGEQGDFDITSETAIRGAGAGQTIIDGNNIDTVFHVIALGRATISGLTVRGGNGANDPETSVGGIYANGSLVLQSVHVLDNAGGPEGAGGVYSDGNLVITDSVIHSNTSGDPGTGGLYAAGGAEIANTTISDNIATGPASVGGAYVRGDSTLTDVDLSGNTATGENSVGGLYAAFSDVTSVERSRITGNTATGDYAVGGLRVFTHVSAKDVEVDSNSGGHYGAGGLYIECCSATMQLTNATISNNSAPADSTAGVWNDGQAAFVNVTVSGNTTGNDSTGGLYNSGELALTHGTIANNSAGPGGAGGLWNDGELTVKGSIVADNPALECLLAAGELVSAGGNVDTDDTCAFHHADDHANAGNALLGALADNGGFSMTHDLLDGSPAIDAAAGCPPPTSDQRAAVRPRGIACDSGAVEAGPIDGKVWGDTDCGSDVDGNDVAVLLEHVADAEGPPSGCYPAVGQEVTVAGIPRLWGDANCDGIVDALDAIFVLRWLADIALPPASPCPDLAQTVALS
jgi:CSLREA domain-containing protein